jgi:hypothetical protein
MDIPESKQESTNVEEEDEKAEERQEFAVDAAVALVE